MLSHCVFLRFRDDVSEDERLAVLEGLAALVGQVPGLRRLDYGSNRDFEAKSPGFSHGFIAVFDDRAAHLAYEAHPQHVALGARLVALCQGGHEGIVVYDIESAG